MASLSRDGENSRWRITFTGSDRKRRSIRLGKMPKRIASNVKTRVEILIAAGTAGEPLDGETIRWVRSLPADLHAKLARAGLVAPRKSATIAQFVGDYITKRTDIKDGTRINLRQTENALVEYFGAEKRLDQVSEQDAQDFKVWMASKWSQATTARRLKRARQFFQAAVRSRVILENPFIDVKAGSQKNDERLQYVPPEVVDRIIDACPSIRWKADHRSMSIRRSAVPE